MRAAAESRNGAIRQHHLQPQDIIARDAIFQAARPAGIGSNVPAEGTVGAAGGIGRIKQSRLFYRILERFGDHPCLNHSHKIARMDLLNPIHPLQRKNDSPADGHTPADVAITRTTRGHGNSMLVGETQQRGNRGGAPREGDRFGWEGGHPLVTGILEATGGLQQEFPSGRQFLQPGE